jgi:hypothetical protein
VLRARRIDLIEEVILVRLVSSLRVMQLYGFDILHSGPGNLKVSLEEKNGANTAVGETIQNRDTQLAYP